MKDGQGANKPFDMEIAGETVEAHGVMVTPVARIRGQADAKSDERGNWKWGWAAIQPIKIAVQDRTGQLSEVKLEPMEGQVLGAMAAVAVVVAALAMLISIVARRAR